MKKENTKKMIKRVLREYGINQEDLGRYTSLGKEIFNLEFANEKELIEFLGLAYR